MLKLITVAVVLGIGALISRFVKYICPLITTLGTLALLGMVLEPRTIPEMPGRVVATAVIFFFAVWVGQLTFDLGEWLIQLNERLADKMEPMLKDAEQKTSPENT